LCEYYGFIEFICLTSFKLFANQLDIIRNFKITSIHILTCIYILPVLLAMTSLVG
jgi:hypothetical protein